MRVLKILLWFIFLIPICLKAQSISLKDRTAGIKNFHEIAKIAELYYDSIEQGYFTLAPSDMKRKHWERYKYTANQHLLKDGSIANDAVRNLIEDQKVERVTNDPSRTTNSNWTFTGPSNHVTPPTSYQYIGKGRVDRIAFHPTNSNILIVGTPDGGMYKTITNGSFWYPVNPNLPSMGISGIAFAKSNPNIVYALTGCGDGMGQWFSAGVLKSLDAGETWQLTGSVSTSDFTGFNIAVNEYNPDIVYIATSLGLLSTKDGGNTWVNQKAGFIYDVKLKPGAPDTIYCVGNSNYYRLRDQGSTYLATINTLTMGTGRKGLAVTAANPNIVYLLSGPALSAGTFRGFWRSSNSGSSFTLQSTTPNIFGGEGGTDSLHQSYYDFCVTASQIDPNLVIMGGLVSFMSLNGGANWSNITTYGANNSSPNYVHPDIHDVQINPLNNNLFIANDGGIYKSLDLGASWSNVTNTINTTQFYHFSVYRTNSNCIIGGAQDNGVKLKINSSTLMDHIAGADGFQPAHNPIDSSESYCSINSALLKFNNNGASNISITPKASWFMTVATHVSDPNILFAGSSRLYKSTNKGASWDTIFQPGGASIAMCLSNPNRLYIAGTSTEFKMHRLDNLGSTTTRVDTSPGFPASKDISDIAVHPLIQNFVYVTVKGYVNTEKVYGSTNGGSTWSNLTYNLPDIPILSIAVSNSNELYIGTDIGVFYLKGGATTWSPFRNGMPKVRVTDIMVDAIGNKVFACTIGRGIWSSPAANGICDVDIASTPLIMKGYNFFEASNSIQSSSIIQGGQGTKVFLKSGNFIQLTDGFHANQLGTEVRVYIDACGSGIPPNN